MRKWGQQGKLCHIDINLKQEIDQTLDIVGVLIVRPKEYRGLNADAVIFQTFDPVADNIRGIKDRLINIPAAGLGGPGHNLVLIKDRMADPLFL